MFVKVIQLTMSGPLVGGFVYQALGWRWTNWVVMIGSGTSWFMVFLIKETYAPAILRSKSAKKRKGNSALSTKWVARYSRGCLTPAVM